MPDLLQLENVTAGYGETIVLEDLSLTLREGETLALLGRNGVGKSTLLTTIMGQTHLHAGKMRFRGADLTALPAHRRVRLGIGYVPQEREIFPSLTVEENLTVAAATGPWNAARVFGLFPSLADRRQHRGNELSGGEQQMLAIGRALMGNPQLLLMDEPLEGLAPVIVEQLLAAVRRLAQEDGLSILLAEQRVDLVLDIAHRAMVLDRGRVVYDGDGALLRADPSRLAALIGLAAQGG